MQTACGIAYYAAYPYLMMREVSLAYGLFSTYLTYIIGLIRLIMAQNSYFVVIMYKWYMLSVGLLTTYNNSPPIVPPAKDLHPPSQSLLLNTQLAWTNISYDMLCKRHYK